MMTANNPVSNSTSPQNAVKQANLLEIIKQPRFSGQIVLKDSKGNSWLFYLYLGRIVYATGGTHPVRRWKRNVTAHIPQIMASFSTLKSQLVSISNRDVISWEYQALCLCVEQRKVTLEQVAQMIRATVVEVLFDVIQAVGITYELKPDRLSSTRLVLLDVEQVITEAKQLWQAWQDAKIADRSPNSAPIIVQPEQLQQHASPQVYQNMTQLLDGKHTLRDLSLRIKRDVPTLTCSILPYVQLGLVRLVEVPDLPSPILPPSNVASASVKGDLIACIDDSPTICQSMEQIITEAGYQCVGINDPLRALATLMSRKPDLIFLDLVMPNANGYEICGQLRKLSLFRHTPIVILTGNDGIIDRVKAKMVGASDFITKPVKKEVVSSTITKHLKQKVNN